MAHPSREDLVFYLNGERVEIHDPDPDRLLLDYLRSPEVGLTGSKKGCGQGGCGLCTVLLSRWDEERGAVDHASVNSCMHPLAALDGVAVTTVEGVGNTDEGVSPVQWEIAAQNGSQCGYCTPGWVMTMESALARRGDRGLTQAEIEKQFDGNLCRCTGYRPILYAMRHFASDWNAKRDEKGSMCCRVDPAEKPPVRDFEPAFPPELEAPARAVAYGRDGARYFRPTTLNELLELRRAHRDPLRDKLMVGNTSIGIYPDTARVRIDLSCVPELRRREADLSAGGVGELRLGAAVTYTELLEYLDAVLEEVPEDRRQVLAALHYMAHRTAGHIVRNAAGLAGNTMLVARHVARGTPFPSDLFTALTAVGARIVVLTLDGEERELDPPDFARRWAEVRELREGILLGYRVPLGEAGEIARTYKVAIRGVNAHSIANAGMRVRLGDDGLVASATVVYGGIGPVAFHAETVEEYLLGRPWDGDTLRGALAHVTADVDRVIADTAGRMESLPFEGFTDGDRRRLAQSYFYQFFVHVAEAVGLELPKTVRSAGIRTERPVTRGTQRYAAYPDEYPVNVPFVKLSAFEQATGEVVYTHDMAPPQRGLEAALVVSARANATARYRVPVGRDDGPPRFEAADTDGVVEHLKVRFPGFAGYVTCRDLQAVGGAVLQGGGSDEPLLCPIEETVDGWPTGYVAWQGQQIGVVLADDLVTAQHVADYVSRVCLGYENEPDTILSIDQAVAQDSIFPDKPPYPVHVWKIRRPGSRMGWADTEDGGHASVDGVECLVTHNRHLNGGQIHFYMETQSAVAIRGRNRNVTVYASTQSPDSVTSALGKTLGLKDNRIDVRVPHVGGGYGGKTTRSPFTAAWAALAAWVTKRPVRLALKRETDTSVVGHRHPLLAKHRLAIATGADDPDRKGLLMGLQADWWFDGGYTYDCSFVVMDCLQLRSDTAYYVPNSLSTGEVCKTHKTSNTAYRAFGMVQSMVAYEDAIERAAREIGMLAEDVREKNLYDLGQATPFGQRLDYCYLGNVWRYARERSDFDRRLEEVREFNARNTWRKRGISLMPLKYGSGYNLASLEQGGAMVEIFDDGTVLVRQGGVEMGQGLRTQIAQIAAHALNVPLCRIQVADVDSQVVPNPTSTGASTGTALNGGAVREACTRLREELETFCLRLLRENGAEWCKEQDINFWDYEDGWRHLDTGQDPGDCLAPMWDKIVGQAFDGRLTLALQVRFRQTGGTDPDTHGKAGGLEFHAPIDGQKVYEEVDHFVGFTYSAACSEVEVDLLTGEVTILRSDVFYDMGKSLNPAVDVGQVEGAFIQGVGYVLTEEMIWQPDGPERGDFYTVNTWQYKPPAISTLPLELHVDLYPRDDAADVPENPNDLLGAKEVGEPPLVLATTVYLAVKGAVAASREERGLEGWFELEAPATVTRIREAAEISVEELTV